ncbi:Cell division suppressor protein YneA [Sporomusa rhizae]|uniref:LysM peptidoglycan-binding domain-containing protein n=1 Tax=Sporomusa rhizae TaxID=357999 RepID=UPI00352A810A
MKKSQFILVAVSVIFVLFIWNSFSFVSANGDVYSKPINYTSIYVKSGDSVWSIAAAYSTPKDDIRDVVSAIIKINGLNKNVQITPGQELKIPVKSQI